MKLDRIIAIRNNKTIYRDGDYCIKVFNDDFSKADVLNEALNTARVEDLDINIPKIDEVTKFDGKWAIISEFIKGKNLEMLIKENPQKKAEYLNLFVDLQINVLSKNCTLLTKLKDKMNKQISLANLDDITKNKLYARLESLPTHDKLCHGDFNLSNVILSDDDDKYYIIDWAHATQGNASADAARTYLKFWLNGDIQGAEMYLDLFCKKSNTDKKYVQGWMPIVAAAQSIKGNEKEREFLLSWVNDVD
ncbi:MAG: phosphotransferase [Clostridia bacterium]|nr:phosphotransferase [Clostridia bacterium]